MNTEKYRVSVRCQRHGHGIGCQVLVDGRLRRFVDMADQRGRPLGEIENEIRLQVARELEEEATLIDVRMQRLGYELRAMRLELYRSLVDVAAKVGVRISRLADWEQGRAGVEPPTDEQWQRWYAALGLQRPLEDPDGAQ